MTSVFIHNFGCRVNQAEAFDWADSLTEAGFSVVKDWRQAELVVVNSCALTSRAEADVRQFVRRLSREAPGVRVVLTGCLVEKGLEELKNWPNIISTIPNSEKDRLADEVIKLLGGKTGSKVERKSYRSRALIKVQDGCDSRCTFCIIPYLRGPSRSLPVEKIVEKVKRAASLGYEELVLAGIHLCAYGQDLNPRTSLVELLKELVALPEVHLLRLSSLDPRLMPDELLEFLASEKKICPHFHLSLQHASPEVLRKMGRKSSPEEYRALLQFLREKKPEASLGADIIVGFPGEGEEDYQYLKEFLSESPLTYFHVFSFSPREGTPAAAWPPVEEKIKKLRSEELRKISREKNFRFKSSFSGQVLPAVVIRKEKEQAELLTANYIKVKAAALPELRPRQLVRVKITKVTSYSVEGVVA